MTAEGHEPLEYLWSKDGSELEGKTSRVLEFTPFKVNDGGKYRCRVSNRGGKASKHNNATHEIYSHRVCLDSGSVLSEEAQLYKIEPDIFSLMGIYIDKHETRLLELFRKFDKDRNGTLSTKEISGLVKEVYPYVSRKELRTFKVGC